MLASLLLIALIAYVVWHALRIIEYIIRIIVALSGLSLIVVMATGMSIITTVIHP